MSTQEKIQEKIADHNKSRAYHVASSAFKEFIGSNWAERNDDPIVPSGAAPYLNARHQKLGKHFVGERLIIPAGNYKVRSNDTDYRFRAYTAFAHLTGLGGELQADAVLVLEPTKAEGDTHTATIYFYPQAARDTDEFYSDTTYGEFWVGPRLTLEQMKELTGLNTKPLTMLLDDIKSDAKNTPIRIIRSVDLKLEKQVNEIRKNLGLDELEMELSDIELETETSRLRLCKDEYEVAEMQAAVDTTFAGFEKMIAELPRAAEHPRGERVVEGVFFANAREYGNGLGYDTIAASGNHANTLHWIDNNGVVRPGDMILIDAGVERDSLYTADITRTLPVNGKFSPVQKKIYEAVLDACEAGLEAANKPGAIFRDVHDAATKKLVDILDEWGFLPCSKEEAYSSEGQQWRRWMPHGTCHHLGMDVHDCAKAGREMYLDAKLEPGMCFTIEPGLYFHKDDLVIPAEFRGNGVRIEDDVIVDPDGTVRRLSEAIPRTVKDVEEWIARVQNK